MLDREFMEAANANLISQQLEQLEGAGVMIEQELIRIIRMEYSRRIFNGLSANGNVRSAILTLRAFRENTRVV